MCQVILSGLEKQTVIQNIFVRKISNCDFDTESVVECKLAKAET